MLRIHKVFHELGLSIVLLDLRHIPQMGLIEVHVRVGIHILCHLIISLAIVTVEVVNKSMQVAIVVSLMYVLIRASSRSCPSVLRDDP